jgi:hypothetical protein
MCLPQVIKSFPNYRGVATTFYPTLVSQLGLNYIRDAQGWSHGMVTVIPKSLVISHIIARQTPGWYNPHIHFTATKRL